MYSIYWDATVHVTLDVTLDFTLDITLHVTLDVTLDVTLNVTLQVTLHVTLNVTLGLQALVSTFGCSAPVLLSGVLLVYIYILFVWRLSVTRV